MTLPMIISRLMNALLSFIAQNDGAVASTGEPKPSSHGVFVVLLYVLLHVDMLLFSFKPQFCVRASHNKHGIASFICWFARFIFHLGT